MLHGLMLKLYLDVLDLVLDTKTLVHAFITSRLDYCNSFLYGLPAGHLRKIQRVFNASARLVFCAPRRCPITPLLLGIYTGFQLRSAPSIRFSYLFLKRYMAALYQTTLPIYLSYSLVPSIP